MTYYDPADVMRREPLAPLSEQTKIDIDKVKQLAADLYICLQNMPQSADMTLAKRKVEEATMWAVKALTA